MINKLIATTLVVLTGTSVAWSQTTISAAQIQNRVRTVIINGQPVSQSYNVMLPSSSMSISQPTSATAMAAMAAAKLAAGKTDSKTPVDPEIAKEKAARKKLRDGKIKKFLVDRRPSTILKTWGTPPKPDKPKSDEPNPEPAAPAMPRKAKTEAEVKAAAKALRAKAQVKENAAIDKALTALNKNVTLGQWPEVKTFIASLKDDEPKALYSQMLTSLASGPPGSTQTYAEKNRFSIDDVIAIAQLAPVKLEATHVATLGRLLSSAVKSGSTIESYLEKTREIVKLDKPEPKKDKDAKDKKATDASKTDAKDAKDGEDKPVDLNPHRITKRVSAKMLFAAGHPIEAGEFLPGADDAVKDDDREALNLLSQHFMAQHNKDKKAEFLEKAWNATQAALAVGEVSEAAKQAALQRAVALAPRVKEEFGKAWMDESFTKRPERGKELLASIGASVSMGWQTHQRDKDFRAKTLELQKSAAEALIAASPERAGEWTKQLDMLAQNWLKEAEFSYANDQSTQRGPSMQRDFYGNYYYGNRGGSSSYNYSSSNRRPTPIETDSILKSGPSDNWLKHIDKPLQPKFAMIFPQLFLKVGEDDKAFPYIEQLAKTHKEKATELADEFLRVWTTNHDPNANRNRTNYYMFSYGFSNRASGIPLTRSKQERNLTELKEWMARLKAVPIDDVDEELVAKAFMNCHSAAEVYRLEQLENVFGSIDNIKPDTLSELMQQMRANLVSVWRDPALQKASGTNRKKKDIEVEVMEGYKVATAVVEKAITQHPDEWSLQLAKASIEHDQNNYMFDIERSAKFSERRQTAFDEFKKAAETYAAGVADLNEDEQSTKVYDTWFYASMGACDLNQLTAERQPDVRQAKLIREAIESLPGEAAEKHMGMFANALFTRLSGVKPEIKYNFLKNGFNIVGDHDRAEEARKVYDYYSDLVTEIKLETVVDGTDRVGHGEPFGVFVNILHTKEIERESGGFSKYLQNQNNMYYSYNYGRPNENYRDKFEEIATDALSENFELMSITFQADDVHSRATEEYGWRITPYAYILLKPRGPEIDKIPALRLDLDFMDTTGYAVLPVSSAPVPVDATDESGDVRPHSNLNITQTLDERQADDGKLVLEVKASAIGLVPALKDIVDFAPEGFEITENVDEGVSISQFDKENEEVAVISERSWTIGMKAIEDLAAPESFSFGTPKVETKETAYQRYVDADLAAVEPTISLEKQYVEKSNSWMYWVGGGLVGLIVLHFLFTMLFDEVKQEKRAGYELPDEVTPFTVIGLLKDIHRNNGLSPDRKQELDTSINRLEAHYFSDVKGEEPDLEQLANEWVNRSRK